MELRSSRVRSLAIPVTFALLVLEMTSAKTFGETEKGGQLTFGGRTRPLATTIDARSCSLQAGGALTMFNGESADVKLPCKYRLADFTCGDFRVKVTPGSSVDTGARFFHDKAWVKVANTVTNETVKLRTSLDRLKRAGGEKLDNVWLIKAGDTAFLDLAGYADGVARLEQNGVFTVLFSAGVVQVTCEAEPFTSQGVPKTLCGDGLTVKEMGTAKSWVSGASAMSVTEYVQLIALNDTTVTQSKNCADLASDFQGCERNVETHMSHKAFFNSPEMVQCLMGYGTQPEKVYRYYFRKTCYGDDSNMPNVGRCVD